MLSRNARHRLLFAAVFILIVLAAYILSRPSAVEGVPPIAEWQAVRMTVAPSTIPLPVPGGPTPPGSESITGKISRDRWNSLHDDLHNASVEWIPADWRRAGTLWITTKSGEQVFDLFVTGPHGTHVLFRANEGATYYNMGPMSDVPSWLEFEDNARR